MWNRSKVDETYITHTHTHTQTHTNTQTTVQFQCGLWCTKRRRLCASGVSCWRESPAAISDRSKDGQTISGGVSGYPMVAGSSRGEKCKVETPTGGFDICSPLSRTSSRQVCEPVERCCICTRHSTCSIAGPSAWACKFCNAGPQCTGCYCWGRRRTGISLCRPPPCQVA